MPGHALRVHTARLSYSGADRLDVTRKGADDYRRRTGRRWEGEPFAPSWEILKPTIDAMKAVRTGSIVADRAATRAWWDDYVAAYTVEMRRSYRADRVAWDALLSRREVTLCCYCTDPERCHRTVLAGLLRRCGAEVCGERV